MRQAPQLPRGRHGQLPGQRLPRNAQSRRDKARREAFLQRWGREGSEPKTAREKLFRIFVESLKEWHDFSTSWDLAHTSYEGLAAEHQTREEEVMHLLGSGKFPHADQNAIRGWFKETADALTETHRRLEDLDRYFVEHMVTWNEKHASLIEWKIAELLKRIKPIDSVPTGPVGPPQTSLGED